jgi:hypothetical protein
LSSGLIGGPFSCFVYSAAEIEGGNDPDVQARGGLAASRRRRQAFSVCLVFCESETGRPPRTLTDAVSAVGGHVVKDLGDGRTREPAALRRCKIIAEPLLDFRDRLAEPKDVAFRDSGKRLHQHKATNLSRASGRHRLKRSESSALGLAMRAVSLRIENQDNSPGLWKIHSDENWRRRALRRSPAVDDEAAMLEQADSDARTGAAIKEPRVACRVER